MKRCFLWVVLFSLFPIFVSAVSADWQLYDDFNSGSTIDETKWNIDDSSGTISVEDGRAKFVHEAGHPEDSLYLNFAPIRIRHHGHQGHRYGRFVYGGCKG